MHRGIWVTDGCGNDHTLKLLENLVDSGLSFGGFADDEGRDREKWASVQEKLGKLLFTIISNLVRTLRFCLTEEDTAPQ